MAVPMNEGDGNAASSSQQGTAHLVSDNKFNSSSMLTSFLFLFFYTFRLETRLPDK